MRRISAEYIMIGIGVLLLVGIGATAAIKQAKSHRAQPVQAMASGGCEMMEAGGDCSMSACPMTGSTSPAGMPVAARGTKVQQATITVTGSFDPSTVTVKKGLPVKLTFIRKTKQTCATAVVFPGLKIRKDLPLDKPVAVQFTPSKAGTIGFSCPMGMIEGQVQVK